MSELAWSAAQRGATWLRERLRADGSLESGDDLRAYYKTAIAFLTSGSPREAHRVLRHLEQRYLLDGGDLDGAGVPWFRDYRTYPHAWLCCSAVIAGRLELARALHGFLATYHDPVSGGFFADEARTQQEIMTTSMAALACLWAGDRVRAEAAADWLERLYQAQPDLTRGLFTNTDAGGLLTSREEAGWFVNAAQPKQWYFQYGISAAFLQALGRRALAAKFIDASQHCGADRHQTPQSGKLGWGAAWVGRPAIAAEVVDGLRALQGDDGSWAAGGAYDSAAIDVTAEFVTLLSWISVA